MRNASTYRSERREEWKRVKAFHGGEFPWENYNTPAPKYHLGSVQQPVALIQRRASRSKYMPHNGKQEMERRLLQAWLKASPYEQVEAA